MFKGKLVFVKSQIDQILKGGVPILRGKTEKLLRLTFMSVFAPLAVFLKAKWPKASLFVAQKNIHKLKRLRIQSRADYIAIKRVEGRIIQCLKDVVGKYPELVDEQDWIDANRALMGIYCSQGKMKDMDAMCQKDAEVRYAMAKRHQFDDLGIEFLPRYLSVGSIGNYEHLEAYVKAEKLGLRSAKKLVLLVDSEGGVVNPCYLKYWSRYITVVSDPLVVNTLAPLEKKFSIRLNAYMLLNEKVHKSFLALGVTREKWIKAERSPILKLSDEDYERGWECLKSFGMQQGDWFVCLHVRERGWKDNNSSAEDFRNADIHTYIPAIKAITDAGGWVIRMGDSTMKPLPEMPRVIDYAHSDAKSDWMDVFLCAQCQFFVGTSSGLFIFAITFGVPIVATNFLPTCCAYYLTSNDLFIPRICKLKEENHFVNFQKLFSPPLGTAAIQNRYNKAGIEVIENTEEEIKSLVEEMLEKCNGNLKYSAEDEELQKLFRSVTLDCGSLYGEESAVVNARIGRDFLRKHAVLLPPQKESAIAVDIK